MKKILSFTFILILLIFIMVGCKDSELNFDKFLKDNYRVKDEFRDKFNDISELENNKNSDNSENFYHLNLTMNSLISLYDKIYEDKKNQPTYGREKHPIHPDLFPSYKDLDFLQKLYDNNIEEYSFCEPLLNIYAYVGRTNLSEDDVNEIKETILFAINYYFKKIEVK